MDERREIDRLQAELVEKARELGFVSIGFADAHDDPRMAERLSAWLELGEREPDSGASSTGRRGGICGPSTITPPTLSVTKAGAYRARAAL